MLIAEVLSEKAVGMSCAATKFSLIALIFDKFSWFWKTWDVLQKPIKTALSGI